MVSFCVSSPNYPSPYFSELATVMNFGLSLWLLYTFRPDVQEYLPNNISLSLCVTRREVESARVYSSTPCFHDLTLHSESHQRWWTETRFIHFVSYSITAPYKYIIIYVLSSLDFQAVCSHLFLQVMLLQLFSFILVHVCQDLFMTQACGLKLLG